VGRALVGGWWGWWGGGGGGFRHDIFKGHQVVKKQKFAAHVRKQAKIKAEIDGMRAAWLK
jgi:hypothetical protein